ncbi:hypothetical protein LCGC14_2815610 [marine sediment metagenome]|uniref:Uncharacterized protein n=1 Tax=marine sediment metagenome TaxID=412755 RepID=A0A0F9B9U1_9ZZZZ
MKQLKQEELEIVVGKWVSEDWANRYIRLNRGHYEDILPIVAQAAHDNVLRQVIEPANQRIEALQKLLVCYRMGIHPTEKLLTELDKTATAWKDLKAEAKGEKV